MVSDVQKSLLQKCKSVEFLPRVKAADADA